MTGSQYKNIIQMTFMLNENLTKSDSLTVVKKILTCLGVSFPNGSLEDIIKILETNIYMGWRSCSLETAGRFADLGVAAVAMDSKKVIIICSSEHFSNLSYNFKTDQIINDYVKYIDDLQEEEYKNLHYFTYNYGKALEN